MGIVGHTISGQRRGQINDMNVGVVARGDETKAPAAALFLPDLFYVVSGGQEYNCSPYICNPEMQRFKNECNYPLKDRSNSCKKVDFDRANVPGRH